MLDNGDHIVVSLDAGGLTVRQAEGEGAEFLFQAEPDVVARLCAALVGEETSATPTPLRILVAAIVQIGSADHVRRAFRDATARIA